MILADSSVIIDLLAGKDTPETQLVQQFALGDQPIGIGDLMMVEVLQGFRHDRDYRTAISRLSTLSQVQICDHTVAELAAQNYRALRARGITVRKTIDTLIATRCIVDDIPLLFADRDFQPFVTHLGLKPALQPRLGAL